METEKTEGVVADTQNGEGEGKSSAEEVISVPKAEYDKTVQTLGSLKRELKDLKKSREESSESSKTSPTDDRGVTERVEKLALKMAGIDHPEDVELARKTAEKWNMNIEDLLTDDDFKAKLEKQQTGRANIMATSGIKGGAGTSQAKNTPEYWIAKGVPPTESDVPDRKVRATIARAMMANTKSGAKFYNE